MSEKTLLAPVSDDERRGVAKAEGQTLGTRILHYLLLALVFAFGIAFGLLLFGAEPSAAQQAERATEASAVRGARGVYSRTLHWLQQLPLGARGADVVEKPYLWIFWPGGKQSLLRDRFHRACYIRWVQTHGDVFEIQVVSLETYHHWLAPLALPVNFEKLEPRSVQHDVLAVALLSHFGGVVVDATAVPTRRHALLDVWRALEGSNAQALGSYNLRGKDCRWELGMWFLASKKGSKLLRTWHSLMLQELGESVAVQGRGAHPELLFLARAVYAESAQVHCEQLTDRDFAGLLQYQAESELGGGLLRARARCAHDLEAPQELLDHLKRPVVQDPKSWLRSWHNHSHEACYLDLSEGFEDWKGGSPLLASSEPLLWRLEGLDSQEFHRLSGLPGLSLL